MLSYDLVVVASYPPQGQTHGQGTVGVASYTKNTLLSFPSSLNILVLAEILPNQSREYHEKNIHLIRCWRRNSLLSFLTLFQKIHRFSPAPVLFEFEVAMFGNPLFNLFFVKLLFFLRLSRRRVFTVLHQVVLDFNEISGHIGRAKNSPINRFLNFFAAIFYRLVILFSTKVIVFEQFLKDRLSRNNPKIFIIPHGVEIVKQNESKSEANKFSARNHPRYSEGREHGEISLASGQNRFVITVFGFLAWYKGTDWIAKVFAGYFKNHPKSKLKLIIAGGPNPNHLGKPYYEKYLANLNELAARYPQHIQITGFVNESDIGRLYRASDLILLPYRVGMSSSGPLSLAFTYHKPFLLSSKIAPILTTSDIHAIFSQNDLDARFLSFSLNPRLLLSRILFLQKNPQLLQDLSHVSRQIAAVRSWSQVSRLYLSCLGL